MDKENPISYLEHSIKGILSLGITSLLVYFTYKDSTTSPTDHLTNACSFLTGAYSIYHFREAIKNFRKGRRLIQEKQSKLEVEIEKQKQQGKEIEEIFYRSMDQFPEEARIKKEQRKN